MNFLFSEIKPASQKTCHIALILFFFLFFGNVIAKPLDGSQAAKLLRKNLGGLINHSCFLHSNAAVKIISLSESKLLFEKNSDALMIPASNMKLLTSVVALKTLGPDYRFPTQIYTKGVIKSRVLKGDLYVKGFGDPNLITEQMWILANEIKNSPIDRIEGHLFLDDSFFVKTLKVPTWDNYRGAEAYLAPLSAVSFNFNTITVHVEPGVRSGDRPLVIIDPLTDYFKMVNSAVTTSKRKRRKLVVNRHARGGFDEIVVSGSLPRNVAKKSYFLNVTRPVLHTGRALKKFLNQAGVDVRGTIRLGKVPKDSRLLLTHLSEPLPYVLKGLNKYSNNFVAEQIVRHMAGKKVGPPGDTEKGARLIHQYVNGLGFRENQYVIVDGSGLSKQNRLSTALITKVLEDAYQDLGIFPEFISSLAVMGHDGSVEDRLVRVDGAQSVRVKTGTLNGVSALSGYLQTKAGETLGFSILFNGWTCANEKAHDFQNRIIKKLLNFKR